MRSRFSRAQAFVVIVSVCSDQVLVIQSVSPRCLCVSVSVSIVLFVSNGGWCGRYILRENIMGNIFQPTMRLSNTLMLYWTDEHSI